jgi:hypothetical protein
MPDNKAQGRTKRDKIFDNTFEETEYEFDSSMSFALAPRSVDNRSEEDKIETNLIATEIHDLITNSRFKKFNKIDEFHQTVKLNKIDINEVYEFISDETKSSHSLVDIFSEMCDYFNVNPTRFYQSLGNKFKEELIEELDARTNILKRKNINRLF